VKQFCVMLIALLCAGSNVWAKDLPKAADTGPVILTVLNKQAPERPVSFTLSELQALESRTFTLTHDWSDGPHTYKGPLLSAVLAKAGTSGRIVKLRALNEYFIEIERTFIDKYQPILAWQEDGRTLSVRSKGPLWLLTPLHKYPELSEPANVSKLIWQLSTIEVR